MIRPLTRIDVWHGFLVPYYPTTNRQDDMTRLIDGAQCHLGHVQHCVAREQDAGDCRAMLGGQPFDARQVLGSKEHRNVTYLVTFDRSPTPPRCM